MSTDTATEVSFWIAAKKGTSLSKNGESFHNFNADNVFYEVSNFKKDDYLTFTSEKKNIRLKNLNSFSLYVTTVWGNGEKDWELELKEKKIFSFSLTDKESKFFVSKEKNIITKKKDEKSTVSPKAKPSTTIVEKPKNDEGGPQVETTYEPAKFSLQVYGEKGVKLFKNGEDYFLFEKDKLSGVKIDLQDNDYLHIGADEGFQSDPELGPTYETIDSPEIRRKKRRLRVKNENDFFIIAMATINEELKAYVIASRSESFIFFGKDACRLYLSKGERELTNQQAISSQAKKIIIYPSLVLPDDLPSNTIVRINGQAYSKTERRTLDNLGTLKFSIDGRTQPLTIKVVIGSDPSNPNILITEISDTGMIIANTSRTNSTVIRPGGVGVLEVTLNSSGQSNQFQVTNRLIKNIKVYETSRFRIPINTIPFIRMKATVSVDILNSTLDNLKNVIKAERKLQDPKADECDVLFQMVYSTYSPVKTQDENKKEDAGAWFFAVLFSHQLGMDQAIVLAGVALKALSSIAQYKLSHEALGSILKQKKQTADYKSKVTELMKKENSTFLFELDISDKGFIACMYRPLKEIKLIRDPLGWMTDLLKKATELNG